MPQGRVIGPLLFIIFYSDMIINEVDVSSKINPFADNTKILASLIQFWKTLDLIYLWLKERKLSLSLSKRPVLNIQYIRLPLLLTLH